MLRGPDPGVAELASQLHAREVPRPGVALTGAQRRELALAALLRIRCLDARTGELDLRYKGPPEEAPDGLVAWYDAPTRRERDVTVVCGHWSALGLRIRPDLIATDTGCWMGRALTAVRLDDGALFQVEAAP